MRLRRFSHLYPLSIAAILATACTMPNDVVCTAEFRYGLNITVVDSITVSPPASATLLVRSGTFADSVGPQAPFQFAPPVLILSTAGERAGTYDVTIKSPGYRDWIRSGIEVTADVCHVHPVALTAKLQK